MKIWAIVPIKPLKQAKSRLKPILSPEERKELVLTLLDHTLAVLNQCNQLTGILVVSADPKIWKLTRVHKALPLEEDNIPGLNISIQNATDRAIELGADTVLILPGDLPYLSIENLSQIIQAAGKSPGIVICPDQYEAGTNALLVSPPNLISFQYGDDSFHKHLNTAKDICDNIVIFHSPELSIDIDLPEDLHKKP
jgi:2-phospho-L-lactate guanylyltransferase